MLPIIEKEMNVNKFIHVLVPSKKQIFARTGSKSNNSGMYTKDVSADFGSSKTKICDNIARDIDNFSLESDGKGE